MVACDVEVVGYVLKLIPFELLVVELAVKANAAFNNAVEYLVVVKTYLVKSSLEFFNSLVGVNYVAVEELKYSLNSRSLACFFKRCPSGAVLDRTQSRLRNAQVKVAVHTDSNNLSAVKGNRLCAVGEGKVLVGVFVCVVRSVRDILVNILIILVVNSISGIKVGNVDCHTVLV